MVNAESEMMLWGFVGPCDIESGGFASYHPAFVLGSDVYVVMKDEWSLKDETSYKPVSDGELSYLTRLPEGKTLRSGDLLWIVSARFFRDLQRVNGKLGDTVFDMVSWDSLQGARYRLGNFADFIEQTNDIYNNAVIALDNQLFDSMAKRSGLIDRTFNIVNKLMPCSFGSPYDSFLPQYIERGLFYYEMRQVRSYKLVRRDAVAVFKELKGDSDEFDTLVKEREEELSGERLSEKVDKSREAVIEAQSTPDPTFDSLLSAFMNNRSGFSYQSDIFEPTTRLEKFLTAQTKRNLYNESKV